MSDTHLIAIVDEKQLDETDLKTLNGIKKGVKKLKVLAALGCPFETQIKRKPEGAEKEIVIYAIHALKPS